MSTQRWFSREAAARSSSPAGTHVLRAPIFAVAFLLLAGTASAGTVCTNGQCITCDGALACVNGSCTCNGTPATSINVETRQGPCGAQETVIHGNGGGRVAATASVDLSVYVSADSAVCGRAMVAGATRLINGSLVNGRANVSGKSTLTGSTINGTATIFDSAINQSTVNGNSRVIRSELLSTTVNGRAAVESSSVTDSVLNGNASVIGRQVHGAVLNN